MRFSNSIKPSMKVGRTAAQATTQGYAYNEPGLTYNEIGIQYGGAYGHDTYSAVTVARMDKSRLFVGRTNAQLNNQGYTYNEPGFSYNQAGVTYGGIYEHDIFPMIARSRMEKPRIDLFGDIYTPGSIAPSGNSGMLVGILGLTYP